MVYACDYLVMCCNWHGDFLGLTVVLALPYHFLDNHGVVGSLLVVFLLVLGFPMVVGWKKCPRSPGTTWVELLVPGAVGWKKCFGSLGALSY